MTAMMSLRSRLALSKSALVLPCALTHPDAVAPLAAGGLDLLVVDCDDDKDAGVEAVVALRRAFGTTPLLIATTDGDVAQTVAADVVHLPRPGWRLWGSHPKGHRWTLLGRGARDARTVARPGDDWDYLFVGPLDGPEAGNNKVLRRALEEQPAFDLESLPWFAHGEFTVADVRSLIALGVRRVALEFELPESVNLTQLVVDVNGELSRAWNTDPAAEAYRFAAAAL